MVKKLLLILFVAPYCVAAEPVPWNPGKTATANNVTDERIITHFQSLEDLSQLPGKKKTEGILESTVVVGQERYFDPSDLIGITLNGSYKVVHNSDKLGIAFQTPQWLTRYQIYNSGATILFPLCLIYVIVSWGFHRRGETIVPALGLGFGLLASWGIYTSASIMMWWTHLYFGVTAVLTLFPLVFHFFQKKQSQRGPSARVVLHSEPKKPNT